MFNPFVSIIILLVVSLISLFTIKLLIFKNKTLKYGNLGYFFYFVFALAGSSIGILSGTYILKNTHTLTIYSYNIPSGLLFSLLFSFIYCYYFSFQNEQTNKSKEEDASNKKMWDVFKDINDDQNKVDQNK